MVLRVFPFHLRISPICMLGLSWAFSHQTARNLKYESLAHPLFALVFGISFFMMGVLALEHLMHNYLLSDYKPCELAPHSDLIAGFLYIYLIVMIGTRYIENGAVALYEVLWACNLCMLLVNYGIHKRNRYLIGAALVTISTDQVLWYFDVLGYFVLKKFPIGVAKYMIWPETTWLRRATSTHHIWFIPVCLYILKDCEPLDFDCYLLSMWIVMLLFMAGRFLAPRQIILPSGKHVYMNVNLAWELWKDVHISALDKLKTAPLPVAFAAIMVLWGTASFIFYNILRKIQELIVR